MKKRLLFSCVFLISLAIIFSACSNQEDRDLKLDADIGVRLLMALYDFDPANLVAQDNLRFQNERAFPHIIHIQKGRMLFWMETRHIAPDRTFQLEFRHNGEYVTEINESEIFFLPPSNRRFFE